MDQTTDEAPRGFTVFGVRGLNGDGLLVAAVLPGYVVPADDEDEAEGFGERTALYCEHATTWREAEAWAVARCTPGGEDAPEDGEVCCRYCDAVIENHGDHRWLDSDGDWWCMDNPSNGGDAAPHEPTDDDETED